MSLEISWKLGNSSNSTEFLAINGFCVFFSLFLFVEQYPHICLDHARKLFHSVWSPKAWTPSFTTCFGLFSTFSVLSQCSFCQKTGVNLHWRFPDPRSNHAKVGAKQSQMTIRMGILRQTRIQILFFSVSVVRHPQILFLPQSWKWKNGVPRLVSLKSNSGNFELPWFCGDNGKSLSSISKPVASSHRFHCRESEILSVKESLWNPNQHTRFTNVGALAFLQTIDRKSFRKMGPIWIGYYNWWLKSGWLIDRLFLLMCLLPLG